VLGGHCEVSEHVQHMAPADGDAVDCRDDGFWDVAHDAMQSLDLERPPFRLTVPTRLRLFLHVTAAAECSLSSTGEDRSRHPPVDPGVLERRDQLIDRPTAERVQARRPVDRDERVRVLFHYVGDVGEFLDPHASPFPFTAPASRWGHRHLGGSPSVLTSR